MVACAVLISFRITDLRISEEIGARIRVVSQFESKPDNGAKESGVK